LKDTIEKKVTVDGTVRQIKDVVDSCESVPIIIRHRGRHF